MRVLWLLILALPASACAQGWEAVYIRSLPAAPPAVRVYEPGGRYIGYQVEWIETVRPVAVLREVPVVPAPVVVAPAAQPMPARVVPAPRPFVGTSPTTTRITPAPAVVTPALPVVEPGSFAAGYQLGSTYTVAPSAAARGDISTARSLGLGIGGPRGGGFFVGYQASRQCAGNR